MDLYRGMRPDPIDGYPVTENTAGGLGVRPKNGEFGDIQIVEGRVSPCTGGMSTATDPMSLPPFRRPKIFDGTNDKYRVYVVKAAVLPKKLTARQDDPVNEPNHRSVEPAEEMDFDAYVANLRASRADWRSV